MSQREAIVPGRRGRRVGRRRVEALEAAANVIAQRGADAARFADVSTLSAIPVSTLQYYFGSREDMLVAAFRHASETDVANLAVEMSTRRDPWAQIMLIVDDALAGYRPGDDLAGRLWIEAWRFAIRDVEMRSDVHRDYATWHQLIVDATDEGVRSGRFMTSLSSDQVAVVTLALLDGVGLRLVAGDPQVDFDQASEVVSEALRQLLRVKSL